MNLDSKIKLAKKIILQSSRKWPAKTIALAWTGGKDSTVLLHLVRETFNGKIPFKVFFNDSTLEFKEIYDFVRKLKKEWKLDLLWIKHLPEDLKAYENTKNKEIKMEIMRIAKINAINYALSKYKIKAFLSGITEPKALYIFLSANIPDASILFLLKKSRNAFPSFPTAPKIFTDFFLFKNLSLKIKK